MFNLMQSSSIKFDLEIEVFRKSGVYLVMDVINKYGKRDEIQIMEIPKETQTGKLFMTLENVRTELHRAHNYEQTTYSINMINELINKKMGW